MVKPRWPLIGIAAALVLGPLAARADALEPGAYGCYVYLGSPPRPTFVGTLVLAPGNHYQVKGQDVNGTYAAEGGTIVWKGKPPLGFEAATLEKDGRFRLVPKASDAGNAWKSALCSPAKS